MSLFDELSNQSTGVCPACHQDLPPRVLRTRHFTCDEICHRLWVDRLVAQYGDTQYVTDATTGKTHAVPTRVILEVGIKTADLPSFPEVQR